MSVYVGPATAAEDTVVIVVGGTTSLLPFFGPGNGCWHAQRNVSGAAAVAAGIKTDVHVPATPFGAVQGSPSSGLTVLPAAVQPPVVVFESNREPCEPCRGADDGDEEGEKDRGARISTKRQAGHHQR